MKKVNMIDSLIENIKTDQNLLAEVDIQIEKAKQEKKDIQDRLKECYSDLQVFVKYMDDQQKAKLEDLGLDSKTTKARAVNTVAEVAFDILMKTKDYKLTNEAWHEAFLKTLPKENTPISYTAFNIKCRSLFNTNRVVRTKGNDPKSSKDDMISVN
ncbi:MAG: hypothetical protein ACPGSD_16345 [Flavobacteriales bacterium]